MKKIPQRKGWKKYQFYCITGAGILLVYLLLMFFFTFMTVRNFQSRRKPDILSKLSQLRTEVQKVYDDRSSYNSEKTDTVTDSVQSGCNSSNFYDTETRAELDRALREYVQEIQWEVFSNRTSEGVAYALLSARKEDIQLLTEDCMIARDDTGNIRGYWEFDSYGDTYTISELEGYLQDPGGNYEFRGEMTDQTLTEIMVLQNGDRIWSLYYDISDVDNNGRIGDNTSDVNLEFRFPYLNNEEERKIWKHQSKTYYIGLYPDAGELPDEGYVWIEHSGITTLYMGQIFLSTEEDPENVILEIGYIEPTWRMAFSYLQLIYLSGLIVVSLLLIFLWIVFKRLSAAQEGMEKQQRDFTNIIAHELKTPLAVTRVLAENLLEDVNPDKRDYYLNGIVNQTDQMDQLVLELIGLIRLSSDELHLKTETVSFTEIITTVIARLKPEADKKRITFSIQKTNDFTLFGDRDYLIRAFSNLLDNAICYGCPDSQIRIQMSGKVCSICNQTGNRTGNEQLPIVEAGENDRKHHGMGLALCSRIFELHGLTFSYETGISTFEVQIADNPSNVNRKKGVFMFGKNEMTTATLVHLQEYTTAMHTLSTSRSGMNLSDASTAWIGTFETEKDGTLKLILSERQAEKLHIGIKGILYYRNGKFVKMEV